MHMQHSVACKTALTHCSEAPFENGLGHRPRKVASVFRTPQDGLLQWPSTLNPTADALWLRGSRFAQVVLGAELMDDGQCTAER